MRETRRVIHRRVSRIDCGVRRGLVRIGARPNPSAKQFVPELGKIKSVTNESAPRVGLGTRSNEDAIVATAESLMRLGLVRGGSPGSR